MMEYFRKAYAKHILNIRFLIISLFKANLTTTTDCHVLCCWKRIFGCTASHMPTSQTRADTLWFGHTSPLYFFMPCPELPSSVQVTVHCFWIKLSSFHHFFWARENCFPITLFTHFSIVLNFPFLPSACTKLKVSHQVSPIKIKKALFGFKICSCWPETLLITY